MNDVHVLAPRIDAKDYGLRCSLASHGSASRNHAFRRTFSHRQRAPTMDELASRQYPVQEHMAFQRRMWIVQRIGWVMLGVISLAALFGLFGYGVLSKRTATGAELRRCGRHRFDFFGDSFGREPDRHLGASTPL